MIVTRSLFALMAIWVVQTAHADDLCPDAKDKQRARAQLAQAEQHERSGNYRAAYTDIRGIEDCLDEGNHRRFLALHTRLHRGLGEEAERRGQYEEAFEWFDTDDNTRPEADRAKLELAQAKPGDLQIVGAAATYFKQRNLASPLQKVQAIALQNAKQLLTEEERQFASHLDSESLKILEHARDWLAYAEPKANGLASERAEQRGDARAAETSATFLSGAIRYYDFAGRPAKAKAVRDRARRFGDEAKSKGENEKAVTYYEVAGLNDQARTLQKTTEAKQRADEGRRQQQFKKDQDQLEKDLGL